MKANPLFVCDFAGTDGAAWPDSTPSAPNWNHVTVAGTFSTGPTNDILSNEGRMVATASAAAMRRHALGVFAGADSLLARTNILTVKYKRSDVGGVSGASNVDAGIIFKGKNNGASGAHNCYALRTKRSSAKTPAAVIVLAKRIDGAWTIISAETTTGEAANTFYWLRVQYAEDAAVGCKMIGEFWTTDPALGGAPYIRYVVNDGSGSLWDNDGSFGVMELYNTISTSYTVTYDNFRSEMLIPDATAMVTPPVRTSARTRASVR